MLTLKLAVRRPPLLPMCCRVARRKCCSKRASNSRSHQKHHSARSTNILKKNSPGIWDVSSTHITGEFSFGGHVPSLNWERERKGASSLSIF